MNFSSMARNAISKPIRGFSGRDAQSPPAKWTEPLVGFPGGFLRHDQANYLVLQVFLKVTALGIPKNP